MDGTTRGEVPLRSQLAVHPSFVFIYVDDDDLFRKFATRKCLYSNEPNNVPGGMSLVIVGTNLNFGGQRGSAAFFFTILPFVYALDRIGKHGSLSMQPF